MLSGGKRSAVVLLGLVYKCKFSNPSKTPCLKVLFDHPMKIFPTVYAGRTPLGMTFWYHR
jgi:hypothetical protein